MKKIIALLLLISLLVGSFAACKKDNGDNQEPDANGGSGGDAGDGGTGDGSGSGSGDGSGDVTGEAFDFSKTDLSEYIELDEKYYKGYTVTVRDYVAKPIEIESEIIKLLYKHKSKDSVDGGGIVSVGDTVGIFYKGYYLEGGEKVYFDGGSNVGREAHSLGIGSGGFIPGFEYNMIGKNVAEYDSENPMLIETFFPEGYNPEELAGKTAYFEVYVEIKDGKYNIVEYDAPEFDESFIYDTLKVKAEDLAEYDGESAMDKYRSMLKASIEEANVPDVEALTLEAFWKSTLSGVVVKKYPESEVKSITEQIKAELNEMYNSNIYYQYYYPTFDIFARAYFGLSDTEDWTLSAAALAKDTVKEKLIFYYIVQTEGFTPTPSEYDEVFFDYLAKTLEGMGITRDDFSTEEEYLEKVEYYKDLMIKNSGEDGIREMINYQYAVEKIKALANVIYE